MKGLVYLLNSASMDLKSPSHGRQTGSPAIATEEQMATMMRVMRVRWKM